MTATTGKWDTVGHPWDTSEGGVSHGHTLADLRKQAEMGQRDTLTENLRTHTHARAHMRAPAKTFFSEGVPSHLSLPATAVIRGGEAVVDGVRHLMRTAMPGRKTAKQYGLNPNHHIRVWCSCMDDPAGTPGEWSERSQAEVLADPRRLGAYDWLGVADVRESGSALALFRQHIEDVSCS